MGNMSKEELQAQVTKMRVSGQKVDLMWPHKRSTHLNGEFTIEQLEMVIALKKRGGACS